MRVLLVEDVNSQRSLLAAILAAQGHEVVEARDGLQALEAYEVAPPELVLTDLNMPGLDGLEMIRRLRVQDPATWVPIIILTALSDDEKLAAGIAAGADDYLVKPVTPVVLRAKIAALQRVAEMRQRLLTTTHQLEASLSTAATLAREDALTGLANRRHLDERMAAELRRAQRNDTPFSFILLDVDFFKAFNDAEGHQAGDECLKRIAQVLVHCVHRGGDFAARYGGEEFAVVLPETPLPGALTVAERIRCAIEAEGIRHPRSPVGPFVTISLGCAGSMSRRVTVETLVREADAALYEAKAAGRNGIQGRAVKPTAEGAAVGLTK